jgi:hypothetical protein
MRRFSRSMVTQPVPASPPCAAHRRAAARDPAHDATETEHAPPIVVQIARQEAARHALFSRRAATTRNIP